MEKIIFAALAAIVVAVVFGVIRNVFDKHNNRPSDKSSQPDK